MNRRQFAVAVLAGAATLSVGAAQPARTQSSRKRVFIVQQAAGFRHSSIELAAQTVRTLGDYTGAWEVVGQAQTADEVARAITADNLKNVDLVFFANTTGTLGFTPEGHRAFYDWLNNGGAWAGVHSAGDTFHGDADFLNLVRGEFQTHGPQVKVQIFNQDPDHPACKNLPASFEMFDEIYEFKNWDRKNVHVLLSMHKHPQRDEQGDFPVAWTNRVGKGRMFYTSLGHREEMYMDPMYLKHLAGGIRWALGLEPGSDTPGNAQK
jgi:type 1 glutamine amidotransferase